MQLIFGDILLLKDLIKLYLENIKKDFIVSNNEEFSDIWSQQRIF